MKHFICKNFLFFGTFNFCYIFSTNTVNYLKELKTDIKETYYDKSLCVFDKFVLHSLNIFIFPVALLFISIKSTFFSLLGPFGTYRILLGHYLYRLTKKKEYTNVLHECPSIFFSSYNNFILKPYGNMPWFVYNNINVKK